MKTIFLIKTTKSSRYGIEQIEAICDTKEQAIKMLKREASEKYDNEKSITFDELTNRVTRVTLDGETEYYWIDEQNLNEWIY